MASTREANAFTNAFVNSLTAFRGMVNDRERTTLLKERLAEEKLDRKQNRARNTRLDQERAQDRAIAKEDRDRRLFLETRAREASALMADPNVPEELLIPYLEDVPQVAQMLAARRQDEQLQQESSFFFDQVRNAGGLPTGQPGAQLPSGQGQPQGATIAAVPPAAGPDGRAAILPDAELNRIADTEGVEVAMAQRDAMRQQQGDPDLSAAQNARRLAGLRPGERQPTKKEAKAQTRKREIDQRWEMIVDINNDAGDALRRTDPNILTAMYHDERNSISDPQLRAKADARMAPAIRQTIDTQSRILQSSDPATPEYRSATRKLSEAYGIANEIHVTYTPLRSVGVDNRGLPTNGSNEALADQAIQRSGEQPGAPLPNNPSMTRADMTLVNRGTGGRVSERLAQASWRLLKGGIIDQVAYESVMRTGRLPSAQGELIKHNPKQDLLMRRPDGSLQVLIPARDPDANLDNLRNTIGGDALRQLNLIAGKFDDEGDDKRGTRAMISFQAALSGNENRARALGYDLSNINDAILLFQRWTDLHYARDAYNDEWRLNGRSRPDFATDWGTLSDVLFNREFDQQVDLSELEVPGTTTFGLGGVSPTVTPLKERNPAEIQLLIQNGLANTPEEAALLLDQRGL